VQYGFIGSDNNFWAGPYGPEIYNVSFSLKYSVDPCASNPLYSPTCSGYTQALLASLPKIETPTVTTTPTVTLTETNNVVEATPIVQQSVTQSSAPTATAPTPTTTSTTETQSSGGSRVSLSTILNIVGNEQSRISSVEKSVVESSIEQSVKDAEKATQQAESTASSVTNDSISVSLSAARESSDQQSSQSSGGGLNFLSGNSGSTSSSGFNPGFSAVDIMKEKENVTEEKTQDQKTQTVRRNIPNNELAGNVSLASLGAPPVGYQAYSTMMPDSAFYAPKEIYKNQRVIDNPSGRRLFGGTDRLHQQMVDEQYK
jgi:hypothetical protein